MDKMLDSVSMTEGEHRSGMIEVRDTPEEDTFRVVVIVTAVKSVRKRCKAVEADLLFALYENFPTAGAGGGEQSL